MPRDGGSGTVLVLGIVAVLVFALVAVLGLTSVAASAGRAASAADLAALAAADAARGIVPGEPCALAAEVAGRNGAAVTFCGRSGAAGQIVDVWTNVRLDAGFAWLGMLGATATGRSRAGPPPQPWEAPG
jgi:secretion/DNA translocation related TadE-like protein